MATTQITKENEDETDEVDILIIGAGPTGLGAAVRLQQHINDGKCNSNYLLIDAFDEPGGLASTFKTKQGFYFDLGGHVIFSHYTYFDDMLECAMGEFDDTRVWARHERVSYVYIKGAFVPYPLQLNLSKLSDVNDKVDCINGLVEARVERVKNLNNESPPANFDEWMKQQMGMGLYNLFMKPYNFKVWAYPATEMQCSWLGQRVAQVGDNTARVISNVLKNEVEVGWGPNAVFHFPQNGGTGAIWKAVAERFIPTERKVFGCKVDGIDAANRIVKCSYGGKKLRFRYKKIITTMPLDVTLKFVSDKYSSFANRLKYSSSHIVGIGVRGEALHLDKKCWLYYPESNCPFYRCTIFSHYAANNVPSANILLKTIRFADGIEILSQIDEEAKPGPYFSLMFEVSSSTQYKNLPSDKSEDIINDVIQGALNTCLLSAQDEIVSVFYKRLERGYPTPHIDRDNVLDSVLNDLKAQNILSRGRFGSWKYEVANQDHSVMQGVEAIDSILFDSKEVTLEIPNEVNSAGKRTNIRFQW